jgi:alpha-amylase/alpha-mannosidase (GH57 family)
MERYICIHGHFYQPPRENPWLETIEIQDSAYPYHDWNERVSAESYAPNTACRNLDREGQILDITSNYSRISFNFGPTLLSWMEEYSSDAYQAILAADRQSMEMRSGHGNAIAQVYNHIIMPLANRRDKETQVLWGIRDFERRFRRFPEGMWLAETAVDLETLEVLAEAGIAFTILSPHQAHRARMTGTAKWHDVAGGGIDPTRAYLARLPSGRNITLFFYDGPISQAVAFEKLLDNREVFANRLSSGFSLTRQWPQLVNIATDGESYGHHHTFGEMALGHALDYIEAEGVAQLTNYGEFLAMHPPDHEVEIFDNTSWSCCHGVERWRSDCGCDSGGNIGWNQKWRGPLRDALDWLRKRLATVFEERGKNWLKDPWEARNAYIDLILDRDEKNVAAFLERHAVSGLGEGEKVSVLALLEMQRHCMLMYTSCGWFFDELSGIETVQVLQYAGRAVQLAEDHFQVSLEEPFRERLGAAKSNVAEFSDGDHIYQKQIKPAMLDLIRVGAHYAVSSLFEEYPEETSIFSYRVSRDDFRIIQAGQAKLAVGAVFIKSTVTREWDRISFATLYFGSHVMNGGVRSFPGEVEYLAMKEEMGRAFEKSNFASIVRLMDTHFGMYTYSLKELFRDEQRKILRLILGSTLEDFASKFINLYDHNRILMNFLRETGNPVPRRFLATAEIALNLELQKAFATSALDAGRITEMIEATRFWNVHLDDIDLEFLIRRRIEKAMGELLGNPADTNHLAEAKRLMEIVALLPFQANLWQAQNMYHALSRTPYPAFLAETRNGEKGAARWIELFDALGRLLHFNTQTMMNVITTKTC